MHSHLCLCGTGAGIVRHTLLPIRTVFASTTPDNMAGIGAFMKNAWNKEPVILVSCGIGLLGFVLPFISPYTKYSAMLNAAMPYNYPVPVRDDGNMPDVPVHPCDPKGNNLEWLKKL
ncbi:NADH dehydrogenase [ubiquinone] 1 alpha subcomplex subunit 3 [Melanotaenia boesemani]|uniref:NADH dehydrogenase [ubiquinone] 1 alpha subcomplex subunit 3 n=1 Tax=Melanotaenia boesemani TaxID=1250792 RepID=UPI001C04A1ED|nr:NADH dehydrogenase [ubiquinone] 1 alpha subcomplex subunit 3 [Melanotaenia boesemani]